ncbi:cystathionine beta-lyase, partial [Serendipita sp. 399]
MMSPYLQRPLELGADIVYDSGTKYLSGHHDLMAGVVTCNRQDISKQIGFIINAVGNALSPFDSFLLLRGTKTLAIRMDRQQRTAMAVADFLDRHGFKVFYPGLKNHPGKGTHDRLASGPGAVLSFVTGDKALSERIVGATRLWGISVSFGAVNSLISMPCAMSHASIDPAVRAARGLPEDLIRLCVGIEDPEDLIDDLENAIMEAGVTLPSPLPSITEPFTPIRGEPWSPPQLTFNPKPIVEEPRKPTHSHWFISAPGKIILFGEHAVVHGVTAIGASVDLRCYALASHRDDGEISLHLPDLNNWEHSWQIESLPWDAVTPMRAGEDHGPLLDPRLMDAITTRALPSNVNLPEYIRAKAAVTAFLYIYMILRQDGKPKPSFSFITRSTLPIGAGLGSSASYSACVAAVNLIFAKRTKLTDPVRKRLNSEATISYTVKHDGRRAIPSEVAEEVNKWAFIAEKVMHGNPSGVDNTVSVHGGAIAYTKAVNGAKGGMNGLHGFRSVKFLLTDSKVPRDTKRLVANVGLRLKEDPIRGADVLDAIQAISIEGYRCLSDPEIPRETLLNGLSKLIKQNHGYLKELGASHISLEEICELTDEFGLCTKLTGAGGGGCAVTLIPD